MLSERGLSELFAAIVAWGLQKGAERIDTLPGLWEARTEKAHGLGPLVVKMNGHSEVVDRVPPFHAVIETEGGWPIAMLSPAGGTMMHSYQPGEDEDGLIEHFKAQP